MVTVGDDLRPAERRFGRGCNSGCGLLLLLVALLLLPPPPDLGVPKDSMEEMPSDRTRMPSSKLSECEDDSAAAKLLLRAVVVVVVIGVEVDVVVLVVVVVKVGLVLEVLVVGLVEESQHFESSSSSLSSTLFILLIRFS